LPSIGPNLSPNSDPLCRLNYDALQRLIGFVTLKDLTTRFATIKYVEDESPEQFAQREEGRIRGRGRAAESHAGRYQVGPEPGAAAPAEAAPAIKIAGSKKFPRAMLIAVRLRDGKCTQVHICMATRNVRIDKSRLGASRKHNKIGPYVIGMVRALRMTAKGAPTVANRSSDKGFADLSDNL